MTPLWHISSHYLEVGVFRRQFRNEQSHPTETNCCYILCGYDTDCISSLQSCRSYTRTCLTISSNAPLRHSRWHCCGPVHVAAMIGPHLLALYLFAEQPFLCHSSLRRWVMWARCISFSNQHRQILKCMQPEVLISGILIFTELSKKKKSMLRHFLS